MSEKERLKAERLEAMEKLGIEERMNDGGVGPHSFDDKTTGGVPVKYPVVKHPRREAAKEKLKARETENTDDRYNS